MGREAGAHLRGPNAVRRIDEEHLAIALEPRRGRHRARRNPQPRVRATSFVRSKSPAVMTVTSPHFLDLIQWLIYLFQLNVNCKPVDAFWELGDEELTGHQ